MQELHEVEAILGRFNYCSKLQLFGHKATVGRVYMQERDVLPCRIL